jgi:hypothetical protein
VIPIDWTINEPLRRKRTVYVAMSSGGYGACAKRKA